MQKPLDTNAYAGFFVRMIAFAIDSLLATIFAALASLPVSVARDCGISLFGANLLFDYTLVDITKYLLVVLYFVLFTYFTHSTVGKMLMRLEVITLDKEWSFLNILYRETIGRFLSSLMNIGYLVVLGTGKKQGFHDMLCDTCVVYKGLTKQGANPKVASDMEGRC